MENKYYDNKAGALVEIRTKYLHVTRGVCPRYVWVPTPSVGR